MAFLSWQGNSSRLHVFLTFSYNILVQLEESPLDEYFKPFFAPLRVTTTLYDYFCNLPMDGDEQKQAAAAS